MNELILKYGVAIVTLTILCVSAIITFARCINEKRKKENESN